MRTILLSLLLAAVGCSHATSPPRSTSEETPAKPRTFQSRVSGHGRPIIFIGDLGAPASIWDTTVAHLAGHDVETHVLEVAGFAGNPPAGGSLLPGLPIEIAAYIRERKLKRPMIVGHMFGGTVAYALAILDSSLLGGVLVIDAPPSRNTGDPEHLAEAQEGWREWAEATPERFARQMTHRTSSEMRDQARAKQLAEKAARSDRKVMAETFLSMMTLDTRAEISRIHTPVVVLLTTDNFPRGAMPEVEAIFEAQLAPIPHHELVVVNGSRHYLMFDVPDVFFAQLDRFLGTAS